MIEPIIDKIFEFLYSDYSIQILVTVFVVVIGLSLYGAHKMEED